MDGSLAVAVTGDGNGSFHVMAKPVGPMCNLDCRYCYYLEKHKLYDAAHSWRMQEHLLEEYIRQYIESQSSSEINFAWQGGEPTLLGLDFFRKVVELQGKYGAGRAITNALQTNGTLLDDNWCEFFARHKFLVGVSVDGPGELHDKYRRDKRGRPTFDTVMKAIARLKRHKIDFNTLTVVGRANSYKPLQVYRFLKEIGSTFIQFIPLVERQHSGSAEGGGLQCAPPLDSRAQTARSPVAGWSVDASQYGRFLCTIFDEWVQQDVGEVFVQLFDVALGRWLGLNAGLCVFAESCGTAVVLEHGGDVFSCDHYVYPEYRLGNILDQSLSEMVGSARQRRFGSAKLETLPQYCLRCSVRFACNGGCPKQRFARAPDGEGGLNYLCRAYKQFFAHIDPYMQTMAGLVAHGYEASAIMGTFVGTGGRR